MEWNFFSFILQKLEILNKLSCYQKNLACEKLKKTLKYNY